MFSMFFFLKIITEYKGKKFYFFFRQEVLFLEFVYLELSSKHSISNFPKLGSHLEFMVMNTI